MRGGHAYGHGATRVACLAAQKPAWRVMLIYLYAFV